MGGLIMSFSILACEADSSPETTSWLRCGRARASQTHVVPQDSADMIAETGQGRQSVTGWRGPGECVTA
jgi:hypothetical protein